MKKIILILCVILLLGGCVDGATKIGLDRLNWSQSLPSGEGVKFSGTAPTITVNKLYSDGGILKFNGSEIIFDNADLDKLNWSQSIDGIKFSGIAPAVITDKLYSDSGKLMFGAHPASTSTHDVIIKSVSGSGVFAYSQSGELLASNTTAPYDVGRVYNDAIAAFINGDDCKISIGFDASESNGIMYTNSTMYLYRYIQLDGINFPWISTWDDIDVMKLNATGAENRDVVIRNMEIYKKGTGAYTKRHINLTSPLHCTIDYVSMDGDYTTYSSSFRGGLLLDNGGESYCWENRVLNSNMPLLEIAGCTDNWIENNIFTTRGCYNYTMHLRTNNSIPANNNKIYRCHFVGGTSYGIFINSTSAEAIWITGCYFEDVGTTTVAGIRVENSITHAIISENYFSGLDGSGISFKGKYSNIHDNEFVDCNSADMGYDDINLVSCHTSRIYSNSGSNAVASASKGYLVDDDDYNFIWSNIAKGDGYTSHVSAGANTVTNVSTNYHYVGAP
ncbi:MAG: right-handed parallel beta-helix repeat-containing protein [Bacilli bacterium]